MSKWQKIVNVAVIAAGCRNRGVVNSLLRDSNRNVKVLSVFDPNKEVCEMAKETW